jgi:hypothetical protein
MDISNKTIRIIGSFYEQPEDPVKRNPRATARSQREPENGPIPLKRDRLRARRPD